MSQGGWRHPLYFRWAMSPFTNNTQQEGAFFLRRITQNIFYNITKTVTCMCEWNQCNTKSRTTKSWNIIFDSQCLITCEQVEKLCERYVLGTMLATWTERGRRWKHCHDATRWYSGRFYYILCTSYLKIILKPRAFNAYNTWFLICTKKLYHFERWKEGLNDILLNNTRHLSL